MGHDGTTQTGEGAGDCLRIAANHHCSLGWLLLSRVVLYQAAPGDLGSSGQQLTKWASRDPLKGHRIGAYQGQRLTTPDDVR
jgi:hypothetical protein